MSEKIQYDIDIMSAFAERTVKRLWITILVLIVLLVGSNALWLKYESEFKTEATTSYEVDATDGGNAIANGKG